MNCDRMNETDVREIIVRPFLDKLGYKYGTEAHIRTEVTLRYSRAFLGRKNSKKDPVLQGRADYICEIVPYGRWVVEAKASSVELTIEESEQAHTYATHPEIGAFFYLLTNGREWKLYRIGEPRKSILSWENEQTDNMLLTLKNVLGPEAFKLRSKHYEIDVGKPLALGLPSKAEINGGFATYAETKSPNPMLNASLARLNGLRAPVTKGMVSRLEDGTIEARISMLSVASAGDAMMGSNGMSDLSFRSTDEYLSCDCENPTIFTNLARIDTAPGDVMPEVLGVPSIVLPFGVSMTAFTQAVGFVKNDRFIGTFEVSYLSKASAPLNTNHQIQAMAKMFAEQTLTTIGDFDLHIG